MPLHCKNKPYKKKTALSILTLPKYKCKKKDAENDKALKSLAHRTLQEAVNRDCHSGERL